jgi:hypothetical protein
MAAAGSKLDCIVSITPSRTRPSTWVDGRERKASTRCIGARSTPTISSASGVGLTRRPARSNKGWPKWASSCFICMLTALGVTFISRAAPARLPLRNTASSVSKKDIFISFSSQVLAKI